MAVQITLIHAALSPVPAVEGSFTRLFAEAGLRHLIDDGLVSELARQGRITPTITARFIDLTDYAVRTGADAILFTCSAFGVCIDACAERHPSLPILKPGEAMIEEAEAFGSPVGLLATFSPTIEAMRTEFPSHLEIRSQVAPGALDALNRGDMAEHDRRCWPTARRLRSPSLLWRAPRTLYAKPWIARCLQHLTVPSASCARCSVLIRCRNGPAVGE